MKNFLKKCKQHNKSGLSIFLAVLMVLSVFSSLAYAKPDQTEVIGAESFSGNNLITPKNIIDPKEPAIKFIFMLNETTQYNDGNKYNNPQIIKDGEYLVEPEVPEVEDKVFVGWYKDLNDESTKIDFAKSIKVEEADDGNEIKLYAKFEDAIIVYFKSEGAIIGSKKVEPNGKVDDSNIPLVILDDEKVFDYWATVEGDENEENKFDFDTPITKTMTLYAILTDGHKVSFRAHGGSAHNMVMVKDGETLEGKVTDPSRAGYTFSHWSEEEDGSAYDMTAPVKKDLVLHAVWTPKAETNYMVVHWVENAENEEYSFHSSSTNKGATGAEVSSSDYKKTIQYFTHNPDKDETKVIQGDGSTVLNVYYSRNTYTLRFGYYEGFNWINVIPPVQVKHGAPTKPYWDQATKAYGSNVSWHENAQNGIKNIEAPLMPKANLTFYAKGVGSGIGYVLFKEIGNGITQANAITFKEVETYGINSLAKFNGGREIDGFTYRYVEKEGQNESGFKRRNGRLEVWTYYERNAYDLTFNTNTDKPAITTKALFDKEFADKVPTDYVFGKTEYNGKIFAGWYDNEALAGEKYDFTGKKMPAKNMIFYARWMLPVHEVRAHKSTAIDTEPVQFIVDHEAKLTGDQKATMDNYRNANIPDGQTLDDFEGWFYYLGDKFTRFDFDTPIISDLDLHAVWEKDLVEFTYPVSIDENVTEQYLKGTEVKMPEGIKCSEEKVFLGWKIAEDTSGKIYQPGETIVVTKKIVLNPVCGNPDKATTLTYYANNGTDAFETVELANNSSHTIKAADTFTYAGYKFVDWNTKADGTETAYEAGKEVMVDRINEDKANKLYAIWEAIVIDVKATKAWVNGPDEHPTVWFKLYRKTEDEKTLMPVEGAELKELVNGVTEVTWEGMAKTDDNGNEYIYSVKEVDKGGNDFTPKNYKKVEDGLTVTNTYTIPTAGEFTATKVWVGDEKVTRPTLDFTLYRKVEGGEEEAVPGAEVKEITAKTTEAKWTGLEETDINGKPYTFSVKETVKVATATDDNWEFGEFDVTENSITNKAKDPSTLGAKLTVKKVLENEPVEMLRGLRSNPVEFEFKVTGPYGYSETFKLAAGAEKVLENLYFGEYTVEETNALGYTPSYNPGQTVQLNDKESEREAVVTVTNRNYIPEPDEPENPNIIDITVNKVWVNGAKPDTVIELWRTGQAVDGTTIDEKVTVDGGQFTANKDTTSHTFKNLAKHDPSGREFEYYAKEPNVPENYTATYSEDKLTVTNTYTIPTTGEYQLKKIWVGDEKITRPTLNFTLYRQVEDGKIEKVPGAEVIEITATNTEAKWTGLEKTDIDGKLYVFAVKETVKTPSVLDENWVFNYKGYGIDEYIIESEVHNRTITNEDPDDPDNPDWPKEKTAVLTITKELKGPKTQKEFKIKVTGPYGFETEIALKAGESYELKDIYFGDYTVEELDVKGYTVNYNPGQTVRLEKEAPEKKVVITNTAQSVLPIYPPIWGGGVPELNKRDHFAYIIGYPDGNFKPDATITRAEMAAIFARLLDEEIFLDVNYNSNFSDVKVGDWHYKYISKLTAIGVITGYPDGSFRPDQAVTRGEFATVASRFIANKKAGKVFGDIRNEYWAKANIEAVFAEGWITGYPDGTFRPEKDISRAEVVSIVNKMLDRSADRNYVDRHQSELYQFNDLGNWHWAYYDIMEASNGHNYERLPNGGERWLRHWTPYEQEAYAKRWR